MREWTDFERKTFLPLQLKWKKQEVESKCKKKTKKPKKQWNWQETRINHRDKNITRDVFSFSAGVCAWP